VSDVELELRATILAYERVLADLSYSRGFDRSVDGALRRRLAKKRRLLLETEAAAAARYDRGDE